MRFMSGARMGTTTTRWGRRAGAALALLAASVVPAAADPRLTVADPVVSFGTVERGSRIDHTFVLRNVGDATLRIDNVKSSCGCTVAVVSDRDVPPGREGRVTVSLDTARMVGTKRKTITVSSNEPAAPSIGLTLTGQVLADVVVTPNPLYLGRLRRGQSSRHEVVVTSGRPGEVFQVVAVEHANPALHARLEPRTDAPGQRIVVELDKDMPLGRISEQLTLRTTSPREPVVTLPVFGSVEGDVAVLPPQVTFGVARAGDAPERALLIRNRGSRPLTVTRITVRPPQVTYKLREVDDGYEYRLTLTLDDDTPAGKVEGAVEIFTNHPDESRIVVPLYAIVRDGRDARRRRS